MRLFGGKLRKASHNYRRNGGYGGGRCEIGGGKVLWGVNAYAQSMLWSSVLKIVGAVLFGRMSGTVSGLMDFRTYSGAGIGSAVYGGMISAFGYSSMFISWLCISVISVSALAFYRRKMSS